MRVYTKYQAAQARKAQNSHFQWLLVALFGAFLAWVWWNNLQHGGHPSPAEQATHLPTVAVVRTPRSGPATSATAATPFTLAHPVAPVLPESSGFSPHAPRNGYELQIALARQGLGTGSLDGAIGSQTRAAIRAFQQRSHLPVTGEADAATKAHLLLMSPPEKLYTITQDDLGRLAPVGTSWVAKSLQDRLDYETVLELVSEKAHAHPSLIRMLNPSIDWNHVTAGTALRIPDAEYPPPPAKAAYIRIRLSEKSLEAFDRNGNLLVHFPCSIGRQVEKRPVGQLQVQNVVFDPDYTFNPEIFTESEEAKMLKHSLRIPPGPNNPVGTAWIGLDRPGYGIHGTPHPEEVGRTESHGCFRLANWNANYLAQMVDVGTPVVVEP